MSKIDWDKAPEGASHFCNGDWFKKEGGKWCYWFDGARSWTEAAYADPANFSWWGLRIERPSPAWSGEGLPPVGTVCECRLPDKLTHKYSWVEAKVIWHNGPTECAVIKSTSALSWCDEFRPIRTPEQIAADERTHEIRNALTSISHKVEKVNTDIDCSLAIAETVSAMIDAGYRKP